MYIYPSIKKGFSTTHPLLNKEIQALKNWLSIRTSYPHAESEWVFLSRKGIHFLGNSFTILSRLPVVMPGCHWRFIRTCYAIRGFALANMGNRYATYPGLSWASQYSSYCLVYRQQCRAFYGIWDRARGRQRHAAL